MNLYTSSPLHTVNWRLALYVSSLAFLLLQAVAARIPPLQSPDEKSHFVRIASMAEGELWPTTPAKGNTGVHFDAGLSILADTYDPLIREANPSVPLLLRQNHGQVRWEGRQVFGESPGSAVYPPLIYAPASIGLTVGKWLNLTVLQSYHLARLTSQAVCAVMLGMAVAIFSPPLLAAMVLMLPMALFQMASPVIDGPTNALTILMLSLLWRLALQGERVRGCGLIVWGAGTVLLITSRLHLLPLLGVPVMMAWCLRGHKRASCAWLVTAFISVVTVVTWSIWTLTEVRDLRAVRPMSTGELAIHYLSHPAELIAVFGRTFADTGRLEFLWTSFLGNLGSLDTRLSETAYELLGAGLAIGLVFPVIKKLAQRASANTNATAMSVAWHQNPVHIVRLGLAVSAISSAVSVFLLLLWSWTPYPANLIEGVQGRYFIAPALFLAYAGASHPAWQDAIGLQKSVTVSIPEILSNSQLILNGIYWVTLLVFALVSFDSLWTVLGLRYPEWARSSLFFN